MAPLSTLGRLVIPRGFVRRAFGIGLCAAALAACRDGAARDTGPRAFARDGGAPDASAADAGTGTDGGTKDADPPDRGDAGEDGADGAAGAGGGSGEAGRTPSRPRKFRVEQCAAPWAADAPAACTASGSAAKGVRLRATLLAPGVIYRDGDLWIAPDGSIGCVGCDCSAEVAEGALTLECPGSVVSPGFVNPHDHIGYAGTPPIAHGERYEHRHDWRLGLRGHEPLDYEGGASKVEILTHELRMVMSGVTSTVSAGGQRGLLRNLDDPRASEGLRAGRARAETFPLDDAAGLLVSSGCSYGKFPDTGQRDDLTGYLPHLGEGIDAAARNELACASRELDLLSPSTAVVHALAADAEIAAALRAKGSTVVWSPRSNVDLYGNTAPIPLLVRSGVRIALGTDWLASGSMNVLRELACAIALNDGPFGGVLEPVDLWNMVTFNAALAAGAERALGRLQRGYAADVAMFAARGKDEHRAVISAGPGDVRLVLRAGTPLYGDAPLIEAFATPASCEPLSVCGVPKRACVLNDTGTPLSALQASAELVYPLFFCEAPPDEPSCVPARPGEYTGLPAEDDRDGDGIADDDDLCPGIFDPIRPLDGARQADADGDGKGDACDECPLDAADGCVELSPDDVDGDGITDVVDNCPRLANPGQADHDGDDHGDGCDGCPLPNPGWTPCVVPIPALRDPSHPEHPSLYQAVEIRSAYVTALRPNSGSSRGFYVQDTSRSPRSGIFVYTGSTAAGVDQGARVTVRAYFERFQGLDELTDPIVTLEAAGGALPFGPLVVEPAAIADGGELSESHASMWLRVENVTVIDPNPDAPNDYDEWSVSGGLRIDDWLYPELDNALPAGTPFSAISGILGFSFGHPKLYPRGPADLTP